MIDLKEIRKDPAGLEAQLGHGAQGVGVSRRGKRRRTVESNVRLDHHHVAMLDESAHAAERTHRGTDGLLVFRAMRDGQRWQNFADFRRVAF